MRAHVITTRSAAFPRAPRPAGRRRRARDR
jgi:hypothetical protein